MTANNKDALEALDRLRQLVATDPLLEIHYNDSFETIRAALTAQEVVTVDKLKSKFSNWHLQHRSGAISAIDVIAFEYPQGIKIVKKK